MAIIKHPNPSVNPHAPSGLARLAERRGIVVHYPSRGQFARWEGTDGRTHVHIPFDATREELRREFGDLFADQPETFAFDGDELQVVVPPGEEPTRHNVRIVVRHVCEALGLAANKQREKLKSAPWAGGTEMVLPSAGGPQKTLTVPLKALPMWLARLNPGKVRPELRAKIIRYQCEAADALADHFLGRDEPAPPPAAALPPADWRVTRERRLAARTLLDLSKLAQGEEARRYRDQAARLLAG